MLVHPISSASRRLPLVPGVPPFRHIRVIIACPSRHIRAGSPPRATREAVLIVRIAETTGPLPSMHVCMYVCIQKKLTPFSYMSPAKQCVVYVM